ncbi:hypothetical protein BDV93DRAFT_565539, partial [Ceratobasidium sp. AG-I]
APPASSSTGTASASRAHKPVLSDKAKGKLKRVLSESDGEADDEDCTEEFGEEKERDGAKDKDILEGVKQEDATAETDQRPGVELTPYLSNIITTIGRSAFFTIGGFSNMHNPSTPVFDAQKNPVYWVDVKKDKRQARPQWDGTWKSNFSGWGGGYLTECRNEAKKHTEAAQLKRVSDGQFETALMKATWHTMVGVWKKVKAGTYNSARELKNYKTRHNNRKGNKKKNRSTTRKGTELEDEELNFAFATEQQSRQGSDAEDVNRVVIDEPTYRSSEMNDLYGALARKALVGGKRSNAKRDKSVYVRVDTPVPVLGDGLKTPRWAVSESWLKANDPDGKNYCHLIDMDKDKAPASVKAFIKKYGATQRTYCDERPAASHPVPVDLSPDLVPAVPITSASYQSNGASGSTPVNRGEDGTGDEGAGAGEGIDQEIDQEKGAEVGKDVQGEKEGEGEKEVEEVEEVEGRNKARACDGATTQEQGNLRGTFSVHQGTEARTKVAAHEEYTHVRPEFDRSLMDPSLRSPSPPPQNTAPSAPPAAPAHDLIRAPSPTLPLPPPHASGLVDPSHQISQRLDDADLLSGAPLDVFPDQPVAKVEKPAKKRRGRPPKTKTPEEIAQEVLTAEKAAAKAKERADKAAAKAEKAAAKAAESTKQLKAAKDTKTVPAKRKKAAVSDMSEALEDSDNNAEQAQPSTISDAGPSQIGPSGVKRVKCTMGGG